MDKRDVGLFRDDWGCTCASPGRLQTFSGSGGGSTDVDGPRTLPQFNDKPAGMDL